MGPENHTHEGVHQDGARAGLLFSLLCVLFYELAAVPIASLFIAAKPESAIGLETLALGALFLRFRCLASPFAFLNFHITFPSKPWETAE